MSFIGNVPAEAYSPVAKDTFSGDDSTTDFTLSIPATTNGVEVLVENVQQEPTTAYTISGTTLSFTAAPVTGTNNIYVIHRGPAVQQVTPPAGVAIDASTVSATGDVSIADKIVHTGDTNTAIRFPSADTIAFETGGSEQARIDSSGNLLVGKTAVGDNTAGFDARSSGRTAIVASGTAPLTLNRQTSDGSAIDLLKDGSTVGSIGTNASSGRLEVAGNAGFVNIAGNNTISFGTNIDPLADDTVNLGGPGNRFDNVYATNGTIQTSDRNEKQDIEELTEAEQRVAVACKGLLRKFRWKSAVAEKGNDARIHFGIIAQDLQAAFEAEGLDAGRYAMFIYSEWWETEETYTDDEGVEQTRTDHYDTEEEAPEGAVKKSRMGVRYSELLAFIIGAL